MKVRLNLKGKSNGISFVVAYAQTDSHRLVRDKDLFGPHQAAQLLKCLEENTYMSLRMQTLALAEGGKVTSMTRCWVHTGGIR